MSNYLSPKRRYVAMRQEIVEAAQQIMQQDGTDGLSMRSIARRVKTSPANLYEYFLNKEEIIFSVYNEVLHSLCAHLHQLKPTNDARTNLFNLANEYVHFIIQDPTQIQIVSHALQAEKLIQRTDEPSDRRQPTAPPSCRSAPHDRQAAQERTGNSPKSIAPDAMTTFYRENVQSIYDLFLGAIERCVAAGVIQRDTSMTTNDIAHVFWALIHGLVTLSLQDVSIARQNIVHTALETFLSGLSGERATRKQKDDEL